MIRMGRSSRADQPDAGTYTEQPAPTAPYMNTTDAPSVSSRAISESDSMARDIKEGRLSGFVGHGTTLTGETEFQAMLRVDGHLIGTVSSATGTLIVGTNGQVDANIAVAAAMINGTVNGDILATEKLQLGRTARVIGNIQAPPCHGRGRRARRELRDAKGTRVDRKIRCGPRLRTSSSRAVILCRYGPVAR